MKLFAIIPHSLFEERNLTLEEDRAQYALDNSEILAHLTVWLNRIGAVTWRVTYKEVWQNVHPPKGKLTNAQTVDVIRNCLEGQYYVVLRDSTCRFLRTGQDGDVKFCLHSEDSVPEVASPLIYLEDISPRLIDDDGFFDL